MTLDLSTFDLDAKTYRAAARFYVNMVESMMQEGVEEWTARQTAKDIVVALILYAAESDDGPRWEP